MTSVTFSIGVPRTLYVVAKLDGQTGPGMSGAEFRVVGLPADWFAFVTPNPGATVVLGDPFRSSGGVHRANIAFNGCTSGNGTVLLYTAVVIPQSVVPDQDLTVEAGSPPTNPTFTTPIFTLCDVPNFTKVPAVGEAFHFQVRAPQDLDYSALPGYDSVRGVQPVSGAPGDVFHFRVTYSNSDNTPAAAGSPRLELDANNDGDALDAGEGSFTMSSADQDSNVTNGKEYRYDAALGAPPSGQYRYRFTAVGPFGIPVPGTATVWNDSLFVNSATPDLTVLGEQVRVVPASPAANATTSIVARIENRSDVAVHDVLVRVEDVFGNVIQDRVLAVMGPRSVTDVGCTWRFPDNGFQPLYVRVDPANTIAERDESNNVASHGVFVSSNPGTLQITGMPVLVNIPPLAPFGLNGHAQYPTGPLPGHPVAAALVTVRPSWEPATLLRSNAAGDFAFRLTPPAAPGTYSASIVVNDGARIDSVATSIVVAPFQGNEGPHLPNLAVQLTASGDPACPPSNANVTVQVRNTGDVTSSATTVRVLLDGVSEAAVLPLAALAPGQVVALGPVQVALGGTGLHTLMAVADPANAWREMRKDDNVAFGSVRVQAGCFDLALTQARITAPNLCSSTTMTFSARVTNVGCETSQPSRVAALAAGQEFASAAVGALPAGAAVDVVFSHDFGAGCNDLSFVADPDGSAGADCDAGSNTLSLAVCPGLCGTPPPPTFPDFTVVACDVGATPNLPSSPSTVFSAWISNHGERDAAHEAFVRFRVDGIQIGDVVPVGPIPSGGRALATATAPWPVDLQIHTLVVSIDGAGQERPGDGTDNSTECALPWNLRVVHIPSCPPGSPSVFNSCQPCAGTDVSVTAAIANDGLLAVDSTVVAFQSNGDEFARVVAHNIVPNGQCGGAPVLVSAQHSFSSGVHHITTIVNPGIVLPELITDDNAYQVSLVFGCPMSADLTASVALPPGLNPAVGDTVYSANVTVRNLGNAPASDVVARLSLGAQVLCDLQMGSIAAGGLSTQTCDAPWVVTSTGCVQVLEVCADPFNQIGESNENNNCGRTCLTGAPDTDLAIFSSTIHVNPTNPTVGQPVVIQVGLFNFGGIAASCVLTAKWELNGVLLPIGSVIMTLPDGPTFYPNAATFVWVVPVPPPIGLRFEIENIAPHDTNAFNNVVVGSLPWFDAPNTPVVISDLAAESTADGVRLHWRCADALVERFAVERRHGDAPAWTRLAGAAVATSGGSGAQSYEFVDRDAPAGVRIEYRLVGLLLDHSEEIVGSLTVQHRALATLGVQLLPVRPQPFRPGGSFEFALPAARDVDLQVFDSAGRRVAVLAHGAWPAGRHAVAWNGLDLSHRRVPAGVYFARLVSEAYRETRRVVLVR